MSIIRRMRDFISGPERTFTVASVVAGEPHEKPYLGVTPSWGGFSVGVSYAGRKMVRPVTVAVHAGDHELAIRADENSEERCEGSLYELYPFEVEALGQLAGKPVTMRAKEPYDVRTLKKLARTKPIY